MSESLKGDWIRDICTIAKVSSFALAATVFITFVDWFMDDDFLYKFLTKNSLPIMGTMLSIYFTSAMAFWVALQKYIDEVIDRFIMRFRGGLMAVIVVFVLHVLLLMLLSNSQGKNEWVMWGFKVLSTFTFSIYLFVPYEILRLFMNRNEEIIHPGKPSEKPLPWFHFCKWFR